MCGARNSHIAKLVERSSRFVMLVKVSGKDSNSVVSALIGRGQQLPQGVMASLTWDRGTELADHRKFSVATDVSVYFCNPKSHWQLGSLAAWQQRKHQLSAAPIPPESDRPIRLHPE
jgi:IS30 family transposase